MEKKFQYVCFLITLAFASFGRAASDDYLIVDLSSGIGGTYPLSYTNQAPAGGWSDEYKTSKLALRKIPRGSFMMGSPANEPGRATDGSEDQHLVTLTNDFYIGVFELTEGQYQRVNGINSFSLSSVLPARQQSGYIDFLNNFFNVNNELGLNVGTSTNFSVPNEEQWEYACRAGSTNAYYFGSDEALLNNFAWYVENSSGWQAAGGKTGNAWGLFDLYGNAYEACYSLVTTDTGYIMRGGDVTRSAQECRSATRRYLNDLTSMGGFRVCLTVPLKMYTVTVTNGTAAAASGTNGQVIAIWANPPGTQQLFDRWTGDTQTVQNVYATNTTVRIQNANVAVTATYREAPYTLTVSGGTGSGQYASGDLVQISAAAPPAGQRFDYWSKVPSDAPLGGSFNPLSATTWLTMPPLHVMLAANYALIPTYTLTVNGGTGSGSYTNGQRVAVSAPPPAAHHTFLWTGDTNAVASVTNWNTTVTMPAAPVTVTATYPAIGYPLTVYGGLGGGSYTNGQVVAVTATNLPSAGHVFDFWSGDTNTLAAPSSPTTTVRVLGATFLKPVYRPVKEPDNLYMVVDLTASQAVSYRDDVPAGGWTGEYQTNRLVLRKIPAGAFVMGSPTSEAGRNSDESQHNVTHTKVFYMGLFEVTQGQWYRLMNTWPSFANSTDRRFKPVELVSYVQIRGATNSANWPHTAAVDSGSFMGQLRAKTGDEAFDLPTEAQWEYACRAGTTGAYAGTGVLDTMGWYTSNSGGATHAVGGKTANAWGLYDMHGNVHELCLDWYAGNYSTTNQYDPAGAAGSLLNRRLMRGGQYQDAASSSRSAYRGNLLPTNQWRFAGLRVARTAEVAYGLTVVNGLVNTGGLYFAGTEIPISPVRKPGWMTFLRWRVVPAGADLGSLFDPAQADTVVTQPAQAVTVTATFTRRSLLLVR